MKHERRKQAVRMHLKGTGPMRIAELTGLSWPTVRVAIDLYLAGGWKALKHKEGGRRKGQGRSLSAVQEARLRRMICEKRPEQSGFLYSAQASALAFAPATFLMLERLPSAR